MAPEQLDGDDDASGTDLFAFGAVLYEMFTGSKAFEGKSQASLISAIMAAEPAPPSELEPVSPPVLDRILAKRIHTMGLLGSGYEFLLVG